ncbi:MAG: hypothetical protein ACE366_31705 [Bradymonadia bacterium]
MSDSGIGTSEGTLRVGEILRSPTPDHADTGLISAMTAFSGGISTRLESFGMAADTESAGGLVNDLASRWALPSGAAAFEVVDADSFDDLLVDWSVSVDGYTDLIYDLPHSIYVVPVDPVEEPTGFPARSVMPRRTAAPRPQPPRGALEAVKVAGRRPTPSAPRVVKERWRATDEAAPEGLLSPYPAAMGQAGAIDSALLRFPDARAEVRQGQRRAVIVDNGPSPLAGAGWSPRASGTAPAVRAAEMIAERSAQFDQLQTLTPPAAAVGFWLVEPDGPTTPGGIERMATDLAAEPTTRVSELAYDAPVMTAVRPRAPMAQQHTTRHPGQWQRIGERAVTPLLTRRPPISVQPASVQLASGQSASGLPASGLPASVQQGPSATAPAQAGLAAQRPTLSPVLPPSPTARMGLPADTHNVSASVPSTAVSAVPRLNPVAPAALSAPHRTSPIGARRGTAISDRIAPLTRRPSMPVRPTMSSAVALSESALAAPQASTPWWSEGWHEALSEELVSPRAVSAPQAAVTPTTVTPATASAMAPQAPPSASTSPLQPVLQPAPMAASALSSMTRSAFVPRGLSGATTTRPSMLPMASAERTAAFAQPAARRAVGQPAHLSAAPLSRLTSRGDTGVSELWTEAPTPEFYRAPASASPASAVQHTNSTSTPVARRASMAQATASQPGTSQHSAVRQQALTVASQRPISRSADRGRKVAVSSSTPAVTPSLTSIRAVASAAHRGEFVPQQALQAQQLAALVEGQALGGQVGRPASSPWQRPGYARAEGTLIRATSVTGPQEAHAITQAHAGNTGRTVMPSQTVGTRNPTISSAADAVAVRTAAPFMPASLAATTPAGGSTSEATLPGRARQSMGMISIDPSTTSAPMGTAVQMPEIFRGLGSVHQQRLETFLAQVGLAPMREEANLSLGQVAEITEGLHLSDDMLGGGTGELVQPIAEATTDPSEPGAAQPQQRRARQRTEAATQTAVTRATERLSATIAAHTAQLAASAQGTAWDRAAVASQPSTALARLEASLRQSTGASQGAWLSRIVTLTRRLSVMGLSPKQAAPMVSSQLALSPALNAGLPTAITELVQHVAQANAAGMSAPRDRALDALPAALQRLVREVETPSSGLAFDAPSTELVQGERDTSTPLGVTSASAEAGPAASKAATRTLQALSAIERTMARQARRTISPPVARAIAGGEGRGADSTVGRVAALLGEAFGTTGDVAGEVVAQRAPRDPLTTRTSTTSAGAASTRATVRASKGSSDPLVLDLSQLGGAGAIGSRSASFAPSHSDALSDVAPGKLGDRVDSFSGFSPAFAASPGALLRGSTPGESTFLHAQSLVEQKSRSIAGETMVGEANLERALVVYEQAQAAQGNVTTPVPHAPSPTRGAPGALAQIFGGDAGSSSGFAGQLPAALSGNSVSFSGSGSSKDAPAFTELPGGLNMPPVLLGGLFGDRGPSIGSGDPAMPPAPPSRIMVDTGHASQPSPESVLRSTPGERPNSKAETSEESRHRLARNQVDDQLSDEEVDKIAEQVIYTLKREVEMDNTRYGDDEWD